MKKQLIEGEHDSFCENGNLLLITTTSNETTSTEVNLPSRDNGSLIFQDKNANDNCWSWVICATAFCDLFIVLGIHYSFGVLYSALLDTFGKSKASTAWVGSLGEFTVFFFCYPSSILCGKYGCRKVTIIGGFLTAFGLFLSSLANRIEIIYFTHGIVFGIGTSLSYLPSLVMVANYFDTKRSLATGIAAAGSNVGALSLAPLQQFFVDRFGWRNCYRFLGGFSLLIMVCGILFRPPPQYNKINSEAKEEDRRMCEEKSSGGGCSKHCQFPTNKKFIIWAAAATVACFGYFVPHMNLVRYGQELGNTYRDSSLLVSYFSISSCCGKVIFGRISDIPWVNTVLLYTMCMLLSGLSCLVAIFAKGYSMLVVYSVILGVLDGSFIGLMSIVTFECSGGEHKSQAWGAALMAMSLSMLVGTPFAGWLVDKTGQYRNVFSLSGVPMFLGGLILLSTFCVKDPTCDRTARRARIQLSLDSESNLCIYDMVTVL